jgi:hypothetical protein
MNNKKDPLFNIKEELDKEVFDKMEVTSQKRSIMSKIHQHQQKKKITWHIFLNIGVTAAVICLLSILGSSYLSNEELAEEAPVEKIQEPEEPDQQSTFTPEDDLQDKIDQEKKDLLKKRKAALDKEPTNPDPPVVENEMDKEKEIEEAASTLTPFDYSYIIQNPDKFKSEASQGILHGTHTVIGESYNAIAAKHGDLPFAGGAEGGYKHHLGNDYLLTFDAKGDGILHRAEVSRRPSTNLTVKQMVNALGEPYYYHDLMNGYVYMAYLYGNYQITMRVEGDVGLKQNSTNAEYKVVSVDPGARLTTLELGRKWLNEELLNKGHEQDPGGSVEPAPIFKDKWVNIAKEKMLVNNDFKNIELQRNVNSDDQFLFKIYVSEGTAIETAKKLADVFLAEVTRAAEEEFKEQSIWNYYSYSLLVNRQKSDGTFESILEGYAENFSGNTKPVVRGTHPPVDWHQ